MSFERKTCRKWAVGLKIYDPEKMWTPEVGLSRPQDPMYVYYHNIQRSSALKPLGQSKSLHETSGSGK